MKKLSLFLLIAVISLLSNEAFSQAEVSTRLKNRMAAMAPFESQKILILLKDRVNVESLDFQLYKMNADVKLRSKTVIEALMDKASRTQGPLLSYLESQRNNGKVRGYEGFWITNLIAADVTLEVINELTKRADIDEIDLDPLLDYDRPTGPPIDATEGTESSEIGLKVVKANKLWEIGITGAGRIVMNIDTGVDVNHPALNSRWRGNNGAPWYHAWFDKNGSTTQPTDCDVHGTHTMGIMCGRSGSDTVGVAPGAQWIAARTICSSPHTSNSIAAFQWAMNPDSNSGTNSDMPDAIGNSWYDPDVSNECTSIYKTTLDALETAGIAVVFSCGNSGPGTSTITKPKNINTNVVNCFSVGNINGNVAFPYPISSSSSRGPSVCGGSGSLLIKPEVVAPGTSVRSSVPGGGYSLLSGTSMACPHVVGAVALLKQVAPNMTGRQILEILYNTAVQLPVNGSENNDYGKGVIDIWAAYLQLGPSVTHTPLPNTENLTGPYAVNSVISSPLAGLDPSKVKLHWSRNNIIFTDSIVMTKGSGNNWSANIPGNGTAATYRYYIKATDSLGRTGYSPTGAPTSFHSFIASPDTVKPVITHTQLMNVPKVNWPVSVSANVTDNIGVDSAWVKWYKNTTSTGIKHFKLLPQSGNNYSAVFNSVNADVQIGDSIFYRVFARDNSMAHNTDSTALYQFKIINQVNVIIGTGTTAVGWPYYTFYMDSRTDMLYLGSEIGVPAPGAYITQIGFNVVSAASQVMNGFQIKMQNTTATAISGFTSSGWTTAYNGTYSVPGTGWQMVTLQTPFYYTGGSNLLIEICFNNSSYTSNTTVNAAAQTNRNKHQHSDLSSGDGCTQITSPGTTYTALPNIQLVMNPGPPLGISQTGNEIPETYNLAQNYPNPFNPSTKINFAIPKQGMVTLKVYDVLGREVANLVSEVKTAGNYIVDFDASALSSGVYFYKLDVNGFSDVKRMMLIK